MITYEHILVAFGLSFVGLVVHVLWWRVQRPKDDVSALIICMLALPFVMVIIRASLLRQQFPFDVLMADAVIIFVLAALLSCTYIISYPGAQAGSPSMLILLKLAKRDMTKEELMASFDDATLVDETIASVVNERFVTRIDDQLVAAPRGESMLRVCQAWRRLLGLKDGEG